MKNYFFQIFTICILSLSFSSVQAQCEDCYRAALDHFETITPPEEGDCGYWALEGVEQAIENFNSIQSNQRFEYNGYVLMNKILVYMSAMASCNDECGTESCDAVVAKAKELSDCLFRCDHPYAEDLCKTSAYINCQCDCDCEIPAEAECDPCDTTGSGDCCDEVSFSSVSSTNADGCCVLDITLNAPDCCDVSLSPSFTFAEGVSLMCENDQEYAEDGKSLTITFCCDEGFEEGWVQAKTSGTCNLVSQKFPFSGCN